MLCREKVIKLKKILAILIGLVLLVSVGPHDKGYANQPKNIYNQLKVKEKNNLMSYLYNFTCTINEINLSKNKDDQMLSIVREAIFNGKLPASKEESFYDKKLKMFYTPYPVKKIDELTLRLFGSKVTRKNYKYIDINVYSAIYKKGTFYLIDPDYGSSPELNIPQVNSLQALGNNLFYVKFVIYSVDQFENPKKFLIPRETWTSKEKSIAYKGTKGYAIVKKVKVDSGKNIWRLQRFNENGSLSKKQLNAFLK